MRHALSIGALALLAVACAAPPNDPVTPPADAVQLRLVAPDGAAVTAAQLTLVRVTGAVGVYTTTMPEHPERRTLSPADFRGDFAAIAALPAGHWAMLIDEGQLAPTLTAAFELPRDAGRQLTVRLTPGAAVDGVLCDDAQRPVAGAHVELLAPRGQGVTTFCVSSGAFPEPARIDRAVTTAADGSFALGGLAPGDYQLVVRHPDFAGTTGSLRIAQGELRQLEPLVLPHGAEAAGVVTVAGRPVADVQVTICGRVADAVTPRDDGLELSPWHDFTAFTQLDGSYRFAQPIPPGAWRMYASRRAAESPMQALLDVRSSEQAFEVPVGAAQCSRSFDL